MNAKNSHRLALISLSLLYFIIDTPSVSQRKLTLNSTVVPWEL